MVKISWTKYAKIHILMVSSVLRIMSQVEHTKKRNSIDSESKSVKRNVDHQNCLNSVFLHVTLVLPYSKKNVFWLETERSGLNH